VIKGKGMNENQVTRAVDLSADKYCSASIMLKRGGVNVTHSYELVADALVWPSGPGKPGHDAPLSSNSLIMSPLRVRGSHAVPLSSAHLIGDLRVTKPTIIPSSSSSGSTT
jgi:hypothetical protein